LFPGFTNESIVNSNTNNVINSLGLELFVVSNISRKMGLVATWSESAEQELENQ
jgi:hypothetical protein